MRLGSYEILSALGAGGMGEVYRARHVKLGREAAVKVLPREFASDPQRLRRFVREARAASALNHAAIVTIYDIDEHDGTTYIAMELVDGVTLKQRLSGGPLDTSEALRLATSIAEGLARAHEAGVVHRDLKPENLMITRDGQVKILDFGLAKHVAAGGDEPIDLTTMSQVTQEGVVLGTLPYMSPEQAAGRTLDHLSDQFSFGVVVYEMLCGRRPFVGDSRAAVISAIMRDRPPAPSDQRPAIPAKLEQIVQRCLEKDRGRRYASTSELSDALRHIGRSGSDSRQGVKPGRGLVAAGLAVLVLAVGVALWYWLKDDVTRWLARDTAAEITRLTEAGEIYPAFRLAHQLHARMPDDAGVKKMLERITIPVSIVTNPPGAQVDVKGYASPDEPWMRLGETPLEGVRIPYALMHWKISKAGFRTFEGAPFGVRPFTAFAQGFPLEPEQSAPELMVRVPGGFFQRPGFPPVELRDYWLDTYEVTNDQFKAFLDAGGYEKQEYWTEPFADDGKVLAREDAMDRFVDTTHRPGPAGWELGAYKEDEGGYPVGGVSWYEAAAYCRFVGKSLPTLFHWSAATAQDQLSDIVRVSNFGAAGPAPVGSHAGLGDYGTYDMAGNVKEWCWNSVGTNRYILGGSWGEPTYTFRIDADVRPPLSRLPNHGFRCALYEEQPAETLLQPLTTSYLSAGGEPVNDAIFEAYRRMYAYDRTILSAEVEARDDSSPHWRKETVSFRAAYGDERVIAHLFLPRNARPPYQVVVWFPGNDVFFLPEGEALASPYLFDFIPRSGRALVYPVYKGTYERHVPFSFAPNEWRDMIVMWSKDLSRTVDYLEQRADMDTDKLAYYGFSSGAIYGPIFTAVDQRFKASVLLAGGLYGDFPPEADALNFAPRSHLPTLMVNGQDDFINPLESSQKPLFRLLGAPADRKRHARLEGGHIVPDRLALIEEVLAWLDRYLGPVGTSGSEDGE